MTSTKQKITWDTAPTKFTKRTAFVQVYGDWGTGKTTFALTAPGPIALCHTAEKLDGVIQPFAESKKLALHDFSGVYAGSKEDIARTANVAWKSLYDHCMAAVNEGYKTIIVDTHTEAWELIRLARFGKLAQVKPIHYGPVTAEFKGLWKRIKSANVNVIAVGQIREKYVNDKPTGEFEQAGQKDMEYLADVVVRCEFDGGVFRTTVEKPWWNMSAFELELEDEMSNFPTLMGLVTQSDASEWT